MLVILAVGFAFAAAPEQIAPQIVAPITSGSLAGKVGLGHQIAIENCQTCHAIGSSGTSPNALAPPFRSLSRRYPVDNLSEAFAEGILVGHSVMPQFQFAPDQVDGLIAYLKSVQTYVPAKRKKRTRH